ncbi:MAG: YeeE/YedE family protein [Thermodesulfatator sp.]|nr:MAG: YeeE/YedE family protein [Thermodesulfatator sp.]
MGAWKRVYENACTKHWSPMMGGILLAFLVVLLEAWYRPWGIVGGLRNWADWLFYLIGVYDEKPALHPLWSSTSSILDIGLLWGAFISATLGQEFGVRVPPKFEFVKAVVAGILMGIGSSLALGCNVGGFYMAVNNLAANGFIMLIGLIFGVVLAIKYLYWELEHFPSTGGFEISFKGLNPILGVIAFILLLWATKAYFGSELDRGEILGGCLLISAGIGYVMHRSRFCMVNALREPFMTGDAEMGKGLTVSLLISALGIAILKYNGIRPESAYVTPTFIQGALIGGFIFGFGMTVAGGCGSGSLWRMGEGQIKLWVVAFFFALTNSLVRHLFAEYDVIENGYLGKSIFVPEYLGYAGTLLLIALVVLIWHVIIDWNEESNKLVIEM